MKKLSVLMAVILVALSFTACVNYRADDLVDTGSATDWTLSWSSFNGEISHTFNYDIGEKSYLRYSFVFNDYDIQIYITQGEQSAEVPITAEKVSLNWLEPGEFTMTVKADTTNEASFYFEILE